MKELVLFFIFIELFQLASLAMMTGGWSSVEDKNSERTQKNAKFAVSKISSASNSLYHMKLIEVVDAKKQVVAGMKYNMTVKMGSTECKKNVMSSDKDLSQCELLSSQTPQICNAIVWERVWLNSTELLDFSCKPETTKTA